MTTMASAGNHQLDPDTQAVLLLCGWFGQPPAEGAPLSVAEYNSLAEWLQRREMRPRDLFGRVWQDLEGLPVPAQRLQALLDRGVSLALAVENWTNQGLWVISRNDTAYPRRLKTYLGRLAPPLLYGAGVNRDAIPGSGLAVVGARDADDAALAFAADVARACTDQQIPVISGGARGIDSAAMEAALAAGGMVVGMLADSLARSASSKRFRQALIEGQLTLLSPYHPLAGFNTGNAMARNKCIYALAEWGLVVSAAAREGGTWAGAVEALRVGRIPLFVRLAQDAPEGNQRLGDLGALRFPEQPWIDLAVRLHDAARIQQAAGAAALLTVRRGERQSDSRTGQLLLTPEAVLEPSSTPSELDVARPEPHTVPAAPAATQEMPQPHGAPATAKATEESSRLKNEAAQPASIFDAVWPLLLAQLQEPRTLEELAAALEVHRAQVQDWLDRGVREGRVSRKARPLRYVAQPSLFQEKDTAGPS